MARDEHRDGALKSMERRGQDRGGEREHEPEGGEGDGDGAGKTTVDKVVVGLLLGGGQGSG
jgi:hypothetical protein